jgi:DnaK suppressor protein
MALSREFIKEMEERLRAEKERLEGELSRLGNRVGETEYETRFTAIGEDPDENASEVEQYVDDRAVESTLESQLRDTEDALSRIAEGTYGISETDGAPISEERLRAYPAARTAL